MELLLFLRRRQHRLRVVELHHGGWLHVEGGLQQRPNLHQTVVGWKVSRGRLYIKDGLQRENTHINVLTVVHVSP